jgi:MFS-type transporter involved in bile tolerance (Atg22 family)
VSFVNNLGAVVSMFAGLISIVIRSMLSKVVDKEEVAKVFTFLSCGEASMPLMAVPLYNYIYINTKDTFAGAVFLVTLGGYVLILLCFV